jgi:hypothetical protein
LALAGVGINITVYCLARWSTELIKIGTPTRAALFALAVLTGVAPLAEARHWHDDGGGDQRNDYAPRDNYQQRDQPSRSPGISLDSAVAHASREGRVLSADQVDGGYRIKVLTPQGRVRVLYYGGGR